MSSVTNHAKRRMKQRCGIGKGSANRMAAKAFNEGLKHSETKGNLNKYVSGLFFRNKNANNIRIYAEKVWIFAGERLITVIPLPHNLIETANQQKRQRDEKGKVEE